MALALLTSGCGSDITAAIPSLVGAWDLIGFTDSGVASVTTGTVTFRSDGTLTVDGTVKFPGQPTGNLQMEGTYVQHDRVVTLTLAGYTANWNLTGNSDQVTLTQDEPPPANTITLRRK